MAAPTAPTLSTICSEALKKAGWDSPSSTLTTQAQDQWMEEIKNDIWTIEKKLKSLQYTDIQITSNGVNKYSNPSDFSSDLSLTLLDGTVYGTATGGASTSITLASDTTLSESDLIGKEILVYSGTAKNSIGQCTAYNSTTKVATVAVAFATTPVNGDKYLIVDTYTDLIQKPVWEFDQVSQQTVQGTPSHYIPIGDADNGEFYLYPVPYRTSAVPWGLRQRYYADLTRLDLAGTLMTTLYRRWRNVFIQGVYAKCLQKDDDGRYQSEMSQYSALLHTLILREGYGMDLSNLRSTVRDY